MEPNNLANLEILELRYFSNTDPVDKEFFDGVAPFRPYEYKFVLDRLEALKNGDECRIHNTSWGFEGLHVLFRDRINRLYPNCTHSDIRRTVAPKTIFYDITKEPTEELVGAFDFVLNISTIEEVNFNQIKIFENLVKQLVIGGYLICTFDIPGFDFNLFNETFNKMIEDCPNRITGENSVVSNPMYSNLSCGCLVARKLR